MKQVLINIFLYATVMFFILIAHPFFFELIPLFGLIILFPLLMGLCLTIWFNGKFKERLKKSFRISFPTIAVVFLLTYWFEILRIHFKYH
jgi:hypothetical protein